jgi:hypothetical protein
MNLRPFAGGPVIRVRYSEVLLASLPAVHLSDRSASEENFAGERSETFPSAFEHI